MSQLEALLTHYAAMAKSGGDHRALWVALRDELDAYLARETAPVQDEAFDFGEPA